ncbi:MAG: NosD domain-containing protein [Candidatus Sigynarchaeum springense]
MTRRDDRRATATVIATLLINLFAIAIFQTRIGNRDVEPARLGSIAAAGIHDPVSIDGNAAMDAFFNGNGTDGASWLSAYMLLQLDIDASGSPAGIELKNTNRFIIIQSCMVKNAGTGGDGIRLVNCTNVKISCCVVENNTNGISLKNCANNSIFETNASWNAAHGVFLQNSSHNKVLLSNITRNVQYGVYLGDSYHNEITRNFFKKNGNGCIFLENSRENIITENRCDTPATPGFDTAWLEVFITLGITTVLIVNHRGKRCPIEAIA